MRVPFAAYPSGPELERLLPSTTTTELDILEASCASIVMGSRGRYTTLQDELGNTLIDQRFLDD
jgi:hypothetical protein